mgnify:CR=1 FL=1
MTKLDINVKERVLSSGLLTKPELDKYEILVEVPEGTKLSKEQNLRLGFLCSKLLRSDVHPTTDNVLPKHRKWTSATRERAIVGIPGGLPCPWCDASMTEQGKTYIAVCDRNEKHVVEWLPWGG